MNKVQRIIQLHNNVRENSGMGDARSPPNARKAGLRLMPAVIMRLLKAPQML